MTFLKMPAVKRDCLNFVNNKFLPSKNLTDVIDFCSELGGYPIYANNAYEWQLIQGISIT